MRKLYLILFFCIPSLLLATTLSVPVVQNAAGTTLDLPIRIADSAGLYVFQYQFNFTFDPDVVTVTGVHIEKSLSENWPAPSVTISGGLCSISAAGNQPISANGILVYLRLAVRSVAPVGSVSLLQIPFAQLNNGAIKPEINSGSLQVIADGQPPEFAAPPRIISVTTTSVKIFWETNEPATADILYGINKTFSDVYNLNDFQIRQEVELNGLQPGQIYFFRVEIRDKAGNGPVSSLDYRFETDALYFKLNSAKGMPGSQIEIPLEISDVAGLGISQLSGQLKYDTNLLAIRQLSTAGCVSAAWRMPRYSLNNSVLYFSLENPTELETGGTLLRLVFDILDSAQLGMVIPITWQNATLNSGAVNISALSGQIEVSDVRAPELVSAIEVLNLSANSAVLTWQTDEAAQGLIRYGTSPAVLDNEQFAAAYLSKQWFPLTGLAPNQNYYFQLVLTDVAGNVADISQVQQFTTLPAEKVHVKLANGDVHPGDKLRIALSLQNPDSAGIFSYVTAIQFDSERLTVIDVMSPHSVDKNWGDPEWTINRDAVTVRNSGDLPFSDSGTLLILEVQAKSEIMAHETTELSFIDFQINQGLPDVSMQNGQLNLLGVTDVTSPVILGVPSVDAITPNSAVVFWKTDENADAQVLYWAENMPQQEVYQQNKFELLHDIELTNLMPNTRYSYRILGRDPSGNLYRGGENGTFTTAHAGAAQLRLPSMRQSPGSTFTLPVYLTQMPGTEIRDIDFTVTYDRNLVFAGDVFTENSLVENWALPQITLSKNTVRIRVKSGLPLSGNGRLLQIYFQVIDTVKMKDACFLPFSNVVLNQGLLPVTAAHGRFMVGDDEKPGWETLPAITELERTSAHVFWETDEPVTGTVYWGNTPALGRQTSSTALAYSQIMPLKNLLPGHTYFYQVESFDAFGNGPLTSSLMEFETKERALMTVRLPDSTIYAVETFLIPIDVIGPNIENPVFEIEGVLNFPSETLSFQGVSGGSSMPAGWELMAEQTTADQVLLKFTGTRPLLASASLGNMTFLLKKTSSVETDFLFIWNDITINRSPSNIVAEPGQIKWLPYMGPSFLQGPIVSETSGSSARIYFKTDAPVTARLQYGLTDEYGTVLENRELTDAQSFYLFGLKADRTYFYQIEITASDGQQNQIENAQFLTTRALAPRVVIADTLLPIGKTFSLPIYLDTVGEIPLRQFSLTVEFDDAFISPAGISREGTLCDDWDMGINTLTASKIHITGSGNSPLLKKGRLLVIQGIVREDTAPGDMTSALLSQFSFNYGTEPAYTHSGQIQLIDSEWPQFVSPPQLLRSSETTASLQWTATEPASAQIMFGPDSILDNSQTVDEHAVENSVTLTDLETGIAYMAKVGLTDAAGHGPIWSPPVYFTPQANPVVFTIPATEMARGLVHELPIMIENLAGETLSEFQLSLVFDGQLITPIGVSSENSLSEKWGNAIFALESGRVDISHSGDDVIDQDGVLCWVSFFVKNSVAENSITQIDFTNTDTGTLPVRTEPGELSFRSPATNSELAVSISDTAVLAGSWFEMPVQVSDLTSRAFRQATFQITFDSTLVVFDGVNTENSITALSEICWRPLVEGVRVNIASPETWTGSGPWLQLKFHLKPEMNGSEKTQVSLNPIEFNSNLQKIAAESAEISIVRWAETISGIVIENDNTTPVQNATVTLAGANGTVSTMSSWSGKFHFSNLDPDQHYNISATKIDFQYPANLENIAPGEDEERLVLFRANGSISGTVRTPTGYPVTGATVILQAENSNISVATDADGGFLFSNQDYQHQFKMSIGAAGFLSQSYYQISADTSFACILEPLNSTVTGRVTDHGSSVADVCLSLFRQPENCFYDSVRTDADGQFMLSRVMAGTYHIQIADSRYLSATAEINFELAAEGRVWVDVPVKKAVVSSIKMAGAENILSGARTRYRLTAFSAEGEKLPLPNDILWQSTPAAAGVVQNGIFYPTSGFFSRTSLSARSDSLHLADSVTVVITAPLTPDMDREFNDGNGFRVQIRPGSVSEEIFLGVETQTPFSGGNNASGWQPSGKMYELTPTNYSFFMPIDITVPAPAGMSVERFIIGKWQSEAREWVPIGGIPAGQSITGEIHSTGTYVLISSPQQLGLSSLELCPNPFSTMIDTDGDGEAGLAIRFVATSATSMTPKVTLKIYNLTGQLVRTLWDERVVEKAVPLVARWNGLTQHQRMARNGRYLLNMVVSDDTATKEYWHSIVLLK